MLRIVTLASLLCLSAACSDTGSENPDPPPPAHGYQLKTPQLKLDAGEEKYLCYTLKLSEAADVAVTQMQAFTTSVVHHYEVYQALAPEQPGLWDCTQQQIKMTWLPLFGGGVGGTELSLPKGAGFKIPRDAQLLLQLHLLNAGQTESNSNVVINMTYADDASKITPAGIFAFGTMDINLPGGAKGMNLGSSCAMPKDLDVFAVQPHMHKLGTRITFEHGTGPADAQVVYKRDPWVFGAQPIDPFPIRLKKGDYAKATCTFDNTTGQAVSYGESTKDEMCYLVLFYTPFDRLGGCID